MTILRAVLDALKTSPMTREELLFELKRRHFNVTESTLRRCIQRLKQPRRLIPKEVYVKAWIKDPTSSRPDYWRAVYAYGAFADAPQPKAQKRTRVGRSKKRAFASPNSVWDYAAMQFVSPKESADSSVNSASD